MLDEAGGKIRVQDDLRLLREDRVQSVRARLDRLCSAESIDTAGVPTGSVQCEVYPPDVER